MCFTCSKAILQTVLQNPPLLSPFAVPVLGGSGQYWRPECGECSLASVCFELSSSCWCSRNHKIPVKGSGEIHGWGYIPFLQLTLLPLKISFREGMFRNFPKWIWLFCRFFQFLGDILTLLAGFQVPARQAFYMVEAGTCSVHTGLVVSIQQMIVPIHSIHLDQDLGKYVLFLLREILVNQSALTTCFSGFWMLMHVCDVFETPGVMCQMFLLEFWIGNFCDLKKVRSNPWKLDSKLHPTIIMNPIVLMSSEVTPKT